jgi:small ligand-binding sensory domain FIST
MSMNKFISAAEHGQNWRSVAQKLLQAIVPQLDDCTPRPNLGFLYITDKLARDSQSLIELLRSISDVPFWVGVTGAAVFAQSDIYADKPAASCLLMHIDEADFSMIGLSQEDYKGDMKHLVDQHRDLPAATSHFYYHPDGALKPEEAVQGIYGRTLSFLTGGVASARGTHKVFSQNKTDGLLAGCCFSAAVPIVSMLSDGFVPMGVDHEITRRKSHMIMELDGAPASRALTSDLRSWLKQVRKSAAAPDDEVDGGAESNEKDDKGSAVTLEPLMAQLPGTSGAMQLGFRYYKNDMRGLAIKNFVGCNVDEGWIATTHDVEEGEHVSFVFRSSVDLKKDLAKKLMDLRARLKDEDLLDCIKGGIYISHASRLDKSAPDIEMILIKEIIGDIPLAGFYSSGEISNDTLYSFTGVLTLFL